MNAVLINIGFIQIRWYSILVLLGFLIGYFIVIDRSKKLGYETTKINDMCFYLIIVSIIGARVYYCIFNLDYYLYNLIDILKIWEGGLAIHGGIISGILFLIIYSKRLDIPFIKVLDLFAPALAIGQAIGRWGNFFNQEAYGSEVSFSFLKSLKIPDFIIKNMYIEGSYHHPTFLYESLGCLVIFILLMIYRKHKKIKTGQVFSLYFILYGILRLNIESLRTDSLMFGNIKIAQLVSIIMIITGLVIFITSFFRREYDK